MDSKQPLADDVETSPVEQRLPRLIGGVLLGFLLIMSVASFLFFSTSLFGIYPPIWPDEALFADAAGSLLEHGRLGTPLLEGLLPRVGETTYWMPPGYFVMLAAVGLVTELDAFTLRAVSIGLSLLVVVMAYLLSGRGPAGRLTAVIAPSVLLFDVVFLRGAMLGRMDMLCLLLVLATTYLSIRILGSAEDGKISRLAALSGLAAGLALLVHPVGIVAAPVGFAAVVRSGDASRRESVWWSAGAGLPLLGWVAYIGLDWRAFVAQFGAQFARKTGRWTESAASADKLGVVLGQHQMPAAFVGAFLLIGLLGLVLATRDDRSYWPALAVQILLGGVVWYGGEVWYTLYMLPLGAVGVASLIGLVRKKASSRISTALATVGVALALFGWCWLNVQALVETNRAAQKYYGSIENYDVWSKRLQQRLPSGSTVLLASAPDAYFALRKGDFDLLSDPPDGLVAEREALESFRQKAEFILVNSLRMNPELASFLEEHATEIGTIAADLPSGWHVTVYRVR